MLGVVEEVPFGERCTPGGGQGASKSMTAIFGSVMAAFVLLLSPLPVDVWERMGGAVDSAVMLSSLLWSPPVVSSRGSKIGLEEA